MELRVYVHISWRKANLCTIRILQESSTLAGYDGTQQREIEDAHLKSLRRLEVENCRELVVGDIELGEVGKTA